MKLKAALDDLVASGELSPQLAHKILEKVGTAPTGSGSRKELAQPRLTRFPNPPPCTPHPPHNDSPLLESSLEEAAAEKKTPSTEIQSKAPAKKRLVGVTLPADWQPKPRHYDLARELGRDDNFVTNCSNQMRDWADANAHREVARKVSWDATLSGWMRRENGKLPLRGGPHRPTFGDIARGNYSGGHNERGR